MKINVCETRILFFVVVDFFFFFFWLGKNNISESDHAIFSLLVEEG